MNDFVLGKNGSLTFSTTDVVASESFDYWIDIVCRKLIKVDCRRFSHSTFYGILRNNQLGGVTFSEIHSQPQAFIRSKSHLAGLDDDPMLISIPLYQDVNRTIDSRFFSASRGDITLFDSGRIQELTIAGNIEGLIVHLPKPLLSRYLPHPEKYADTIVPVKSGIGFLASNYIQNLASQIGCIPAEASLDIIDHLIQLIAIAISAIHHESPINNNICVKRALLPQVKHYIESQLSDASLTPKSIARKHGISIRHLYQLFESEEHTLSRYIINRRLSRSCQSLKNLRLSKLSITEIAFQNGFNDISHFSKAFKKKYGLSPRAYRAAYLPQIPGLIVDGGQVPA